MRPSSIHAGAARLSRPKSNSTSSKTTKTRTTSAMKGEKLATMVSKPLTPTILRKRERGAPTNNYHLTRTQQRTNNRRKTILCSQIWRRYLSSRLLDSVSSSLSSMRKKRKWASTNQSINSLWTRGTLLSLKRKMTMQLISSSVRVKTANTLTRDKSISRSDHSTSSTRPITSAIWTRTNLVICSVSMMATLCPNTHYSGKTTGAYSSRSLFWTAYIIVPIQT